MLGSTNDLALNVENDPKGLAIFKHYHNVIPMAREVRKPIFLLKLADGAILAHYHAVLRTYADFNMLTEKILEGINA